MNKILLSHFLCIFLTLFHSITPEENRNNKFTQEHLLEDIYVSQNLALNKVATQSSSQLGGTPNKANDGDTNGDFWLGNSVSLTNWETNPWWEVDIESIQFIEEIRVWNRTDCCSQHLSNFFILISESPFVSTDLTETRNQTGVSEFYFQGEAGFPSTIAINQTAQYIRIQIEGSQFLGLAEFEVIGNNCSPAGTPCDDNDPNTENDIEDGNCNCAGIPACDAPDNLALTGISSQSSTQLSAGSDRAHDGNLDGDFWGGNSVTLTNWELNPWWEIDLGLIASIETINVWNRTDCCEEHLSNFSVFVSETPFNSTDLEETRNQSGVSEFFVSQEAQRPTSISIGELSGRYVRIQIDGTKFLALAEIEVLGCESNTNCPPSGTPCDDGDVTTENDIEDGNCNCAGSPVNQDCNTPQNIASNGQATQSSTQFNATADRAIDGNNDGDFWSGNSVSLTNWETEAWWELDLGTAYEIEQIKIWNREDCCEEHLSDFYILTSETAFISTDLTETRNQAGVTELYVSNEVLRPTDFAINLNARYIRIQINGDRFLGLAEVEVIGCAISNNCPPAGTPCDDGNDLTSNDIEDGDCNCTGIPIDSGICNLCSSNGELCLATYPTDIIYTINCEDQLPVTISWEQPTVNATNAGMTTISNLTYFDPQTTESEFYTGKTSIQYKITDDNCNEFYYTFSITVQKSSSLEFTNCPDDITATAEFINGEWGAYINWDALEYENICTCCDQGCAVYPNIREGLDSGSFFPLGRTVVRYAANNGPGCANAAYCSFVVEVIEPDCSIASTNSSVDYPEICPETDKGITILPGMIYPEPTNSYIIATQRNHVWDDFDISINLCNLQDQYTNESYRNLILNKFKSEIKPVFGQQKMLYRYGGTYIDGLLAETYGNTGWHMDCANTLPPNGSYPYDPFSNFISEALQMETDMLITVNYGSGTADEAANVVNTLSPYGVTHYEIGNEIAWNAMKGWEPQVCSKDNPCTITDDCGNTHLIDHNARSSEAYGEGAADFVHAMRSATTLDLKIGMVAGVSAEWGGNWGIGVYDQHLDSLFIKMLAPMKTLSETTGVDCLPDYMIFHNYPSYPLAPGAESFGAVSDLCDEEFAKMVMAHNTREINILNSLVIPALESAKLQLGIDKTITLGNTEYYTHILGPSRPEITHGTLEALYTADNIITALKMDLEMAVNDAFYTRPGGIDPCGNPQDNSINLFFDVCDPTKTKPVFDVFKEVAARFGDTKVKTSAYNLENINVPHYQDGDESSFEELGYFTTVRNDGTMILFVVNRIESPVTVKVNPNMPIQNALLTTLNGGSYASPSFSLTESSLTDLNAVTFPAASVSFLELCPEGSTCLDTPQGRQVSIDQSKIQEVSVSPNPFTSETVLDFQINSPQEGRIKIYNTKGQLLQTHNIVFHEGKNEFIIKGDQLPAGILFFTIQTKKETYQGKVLKLN